MNGALVQVEISVPSAVADALRSAGARPIDMPATPMRVWEALNAAE